MANIAKSQITQPNIQANTLRHDWQQSEVEALFTQPFNDLLFQAQTIHRQFFDPNEVQLSTLLNVKTGACAEDCAYCSQSARYDTGLERDPIMPINQVVAEAKAAKAQGASRFCMGAAWRQPKQKGFNDILDMIREIKALDMETCATLGMLTETQAAELKGAGLDYYNHNLDTSEAFYPQIITTRCFQDRLDTLHTVRDAGMKICSGGIIGMGETLSDRASMFISLANLPKHPESVPVNQLVKIEGTPLATDNSELDPFEIVRCIAVTRIMMPASYVRLSAGRADMSEAIQSLCFLAGANSIFYGDKLLTTDNASTQADQNLLTKLGIRAAP